MCDEIKEINTARVVGLRRITGEINRKTEDQFKNEYCTEVCTFRKMKQIVGPSLKKMGTLQSIMKRKHIDRTNKQASKSKRKKVGFDNKERAQKICVGVTCNKIFHG